MTILEYLKLMRRNLLNETSIDPDKNMTDYEVILHYCAASGGDKDMGFEDVDLPIIIAITQATPEIPTEDQRTIALEYTRFPEGKTDFEDGAIVLDEKRTRQQQYRIASYLYIELAFWNLVKKDCKTISMAKGKKVRQWFRDSFENISSWERFQRKMIVENEYHRRVREKDKEYPGDKERLIRELKKYTGYTKIAGETFDEEAAWDIVGKMVEEKKREDEEWEKELEKLSGIPGSKPDIEALFEMAVQEVKEAEEKKAKANSNNAQQED